MIFWYQIRETVCLQGALGEGCEGLDVGAGSVAGAVMKEQCRSTAKGDTSEQHWIVHALAVAPKQQRTMGILTIVKFAVSMLGLRRLRILLLRATS